MCSRNRFESHEVSTESAARKPKTRVQESVLANSLIRAKRLGYIRDVGSDLFARVRDIIYKTDGCCQERIQRMLRHFGRSRRHTHQIALHFAQNANYLLRSLIID